MHTCDIFLKGVIFFWSKWPNMSQFSSLDMLLESFENLLSGKYVLQIEQIYVGLFIEVLHLMIAAATDYL